MANNPGKRGKPAPWVIRAEEARARAFETYRLANHSAYAEWSRRRGEAARAIGNVANDPHHLKAATRQKFRRWDKANPSPLSWEDWKRLEEAFSETYVPVDYS